VVVLGLFFTGFISIFSQAQTAPGNPDFWKVTILCLLSGTFSDRLFQAAARRMEQYLGGSEEGVKAATHAAARQASAKKISARKTGGRARGGARRRGQT
jgi:hypothetical protein